MQVYPGRRMRKVVRRATRRDFASAESFNDTEIRSGHGELTWRHCGLWGWVNYGGRCVAGERLLNRVVCASVSADVRYAPEQSGDSLLRFGANTRQKTGGWSVWSCIRGHVTGRWSVHSVLCYPISPTSRNTCPELRKRLSSGGHRSLAKQGGTLSHS